MSTYDEMKGKPLPDHTNYDYYECLAKVVLEEIFPTEFHDLIIADKPDLQSEKLNVGIEVTRACNYKQEENESLYSKILRNQVKDKESAIIRINNSYKSRKLNLFGKEYQEPTRFNTGFLLGIPQKDDLKEEYRLCKEKLKKLNSGGYKIYHNNILFIHSSILATQDMINAIALEVVKYQINFKNKFNRIYIYSAHSLYDLDMLTCKGNIIDTSDYQYKFTRVVRDMVIRKEIEILG